MSDDSHAYPLTGYVKKDDPPLDRALRALGELGYANLRQSDLVRLDPPDTFEEELNVMADVRAYFQVAYKVRE